MMASFTKWDNSLSGTFQAGPMGVPLCEVLLYTETKPEKKPNYTYIVRDSRDTLQLWEIVNRSTCRHMYFGENQTFAQKQITFKLAVVSSLFTEGQGMERMNCQVILCLRSKTRSLSIKIIVVIL